MDMVDALWRMLLEVGERIANDLDAWVAPVLGPLTVSMEDTVRLMHRSSMVLVQSVVTLCGEG